MTRTVLLRNEEGVNKIDTELYNLQTLSEKLLRELINPQSLKRLKETDMPIYGLAFLVKAHYSALLCLSDYRYRNSAAVILRTLIECMANIRWVHETIGDSTERVKRLKYLTKREREYIKFRTTHPNRVPQQIIGDTSLRERIKAMGREWSFFYDQLSFISHADPSTVRYEFEEYGSNTSAISNLATDIVLECAQMLMNLLPLKSKNKVILATRRKGLARSQEKIYRTLVNSIPDSDKSIFMQFAQKAFRTKL